MSIKSYSDEGGGGGIVFGMYWWNFYPVIAHGVSFWCPRPSWLSASCKKRRKKKNDKQPRVGIYTVIDGSRM